MTKEQTTSILQQLDGTYKNFMMGRNQETVLKAWLEIMKDQDYEKVHTKLINWITENNNPPNIKDLIYIDWRKKYEHRN